MSAAGPTYSWEVEAIGHADRHRPHSRQSSYRRYAQAYRGFRFGQEFARADGRVVILEASVELVHVHHEVGEDRDVRERLDRDLIREFGHRRHAGKCLAPVHQHPAGVAGGVQARVTQREGSVTMKLDPEQGAEHRRVRSDGDDELIEALPVVAAALEAEHLEPASLGACLGLLSGHRDHQASW
jgi:hypothetical protein